MVMLYLSFNLVLHFRHIKVYILIKLIQIKKYIYILHYITIIQLQTQDSTTVLSLRLRIKRPICSLNCHCSYLCVLCSQDIPASLSSLRPLMRWPDIMNTASLRYKYSCKYVPNIHSLISKHSLIIDSNFMGGTGYWSWTLWGPETSIWEPLRCTTFLCLLC